WSNISKVTLIGGFNGAGCDTADADLPDHKGCQARLFPSGTNTINWTRDATAATSLSTATSTVMVVEAGSEWGVQKATITAGNNGGAGANATNEYNGATIASVARANTWVWGTGTTDGSGIGDNSEAVLITLGDGVNKNSFENRLSAGVEVANSALNFDVWAMTHPFLAVDYQFKAEGAPTNDSGAQTRDVTVAAATTANARFALGYNGMNAATNDTNYPRPMFFTRYTSNTNVRMERQRWG